MTMGGHMKRIIIYALLLGVVACNKAPTNEILVGAFLPMSGDLATYGQDAHAGVTMAVDEVNATGGILGKKIKLITEDEQSKPEEARTAALKLIQRHGVSVLIGDMASGSTLAAAPEIQRRKIPVVSPASTNPKVTEVGDYIFRTCFTDPFQGEAMGKFAVESLHLKKFAILKDVKSDYSMGLAQNFTATIKRLGGEIVAEEAYSSGDVEFRSQLTSIKSKTPEAIFIPGYYTEVGLVARQARSLGLSLPLLGGDGWDSPKTIEIGGSDINDSYFSTAFVAADPDAAVQAFITRFEERYHHVPSGMAVMGYEAARLVMDAITRAGSTEPAKIRDALAATKDFVSVTGKMTVGPDRNMRKRLVIVKIADGKSNFFVAINP